MQQVNFALQNTAYQPLPAMAMCSVKQNFGKFIEKYRKSENCLYCIIIIIFLTGWKVRVFKVQFISNYLSINPVVFVFPVPSIKRMLETQASNIRMLLVYKEFSQNKYSIELIYTLIISVPYLTEYTDKALAFRKVII